MSVARHRQPVKANSAASADHQELDAANALRAGRSQKPAPSLDDPWAPISSPPPLAASLPKPAAGKTGKGQAGTDNGFADSLTSARIPPGRLSTCRRRTIQFSKIVECRGPAFNASRPPQGTPGVSRSRDAQYDVRRWSAQASDSTSQLRSASAGFRAKTTPLADGRPIKPRAR